MKDNVTHIPALRFGEAYKSLDTNDLGTVLKSGNRLEVSVVNADIIRRDKRAIDGERVAKKDSCRDIAGLRGKGFRDLPGGRVGIRNGWGNANGRGLRDRAFGSDRSTAFALPI